MRKAAPLPGLCADGAAFLAQGSDTRPSLFFLMWAAHCSAAVGVAPFVPALPLLEKKACMISYMKDICNWTAGPMQYIYNSKQNRFEPVPSVSPPSLPGETHLHIFKKTRDQKLDKTQVNVPVTGFISCMNVGSACRSRGFHFISASQAFASVAFREIQWILTRSEIYTCNAVILKDLKG